MRLAILSDIHANLPALQAVLDDLRPFHPDAILVAGDLVNMGPFPCETLALLRNSGCSMIRGNGDDYLLAYERGLWSSEMTVCKQWAMTRWAHDQVACAAASDDSSTGLDFIASLPDRLILTPTALPTILMVHGSPRRSNEGLFPEQDPQVVETMRQAGMDFSENSLIPLADTLDQIEQSVLICGHTHIQWQHVCATCTGGAGKLALNPGSVGVSSNGDPRAQYALLTGQSGAWQVQQHLVAYDINRVHTGFLQSGLLEIGGIFARLCMLDMLTCRNSTWRFSLHLQQIALQRGLQRALVFPDAIWEEAGATFDWDSYQPSPASQWDGSN